jgi:hypothetical protein
MLKTSASGVLASLRGSTYRSVRLASSLAAALLDGLFEHPAGYSRPISIYSITLGQYSESELLRILLPPVMRENARSACGGILLVGAIFCLSVSSVFAQTDIQANKTVAPPEDVRAFDTPSDGGGSLTVLWSPAPSDSAETKYQVLLSEATTVPNPAAMKVVAEFPANQRYVRESKWPWWTRPATGDQHQVTLRNGKGVELKDGTAYLVTVARVSGNDRGIATPVQAMPQPDWINWNQMNNLILALLFGGIVFYAIGTARKRDIFLRRIPGLAAVDEAIGRATELGKPILYLTGAHDMHDPSTIAAAIILGRVAKRL